MRPLLLGSSLLLCLLLATAAGAANPIVRFATDLGGFDVELCESTSAACEKAAPLTVANFLTYVDDGSYADSIVHRSVPGFVIQGGSFRVTPGPLVTSVTDPTDPTVPNEFDGFPIRRGTVVVPLLGSASDPCDTNENSGTSGWFINLVDNDDLACGLFTVFGVVLGDGMQVVDAIGQLPRLQFFFPGPNTTYAFLLPLFEPDDLVRAFITVPFPQSFRDRFLDETQPEPTIQEVAEAFITVDVTRVPEPGAAAASAAAVLVLGLLAARRAGRRSACIPLRARGARCAGVALAVVLLSSGGAEASVRAVASPGAGEPPARGDDATVALAALRCAAAAEAGLWSAEATEWPARAAAAAADAGWRALESTVPAPLLERAALWHGRAVTAHRVAGVAATAGARLERIVARTGGVLAAADRVLDAAAIATIALLALGLAARRTAPGAQRRRGPSAPEGGPR